MRIPINLSSEPFRKDRPMFIASTVCGILLIGLLGVLVILITNERARAKDARVAVEKLSDQLRTAAAEQARLDEFLRQPANAQVLAQSQLLNTLIDRKSISWTRIFADLESVLPYDVRLISVRLPAINSRNEVLLDMVVGAKDPSAVIGFFKKLEESPLFGPIEGHSSLPPSQQEPLFRYRVTVNYAQKL
jgi:type IV pilus assembly protein PilN